MGAKAFNDLYGTNASKSNAFGKCVSKLKKSDSSTEQKAHANAARACDAERTQLGDDAFQDKYSTNKNKHNPHGTNGFGKCVSSKAKTQSDQDEDAQQQATISAARQCRAERAQLGKDAFDNKYGTNRNKRNAFGRCVSQKAKAQQQS
jgi:hypothetical protein